jgi:hypothetical protein
VPAVSKSIVVASQPSVLVAPLYAHDTVTGWWYQPWQSEDPGLHSTDTWGIAREAPAPTPRNTAPKSAAASRRTAQGSLTRGTRAVSATKEPEASANTIRAPAAASRLPRGPPSWGAAAAATREAGASGECVSPAGPPALVARRFLGAAGRATLVGRPLEGARVLRRGEAAGAARRASWRGGAAGRASWRGGAGLTSAAAGIDLRGALGLGGASAGGAP